MRKSGFMVVEYKHGDYVVELCGDMCKVWKGYGLPSYEGLIDGIQETYPDLWQAMLKDQAIKAK